MGIKLSLQKVHNENARLACVIYMYMYLTGLLLEGND